MAIRKTNTSQVPYNSPGIYFRETDLTVVSRQTGGFSAAAIGLMEKGAAFEITNSTTYEDRAFRMGDLNPNYPSSYFAKQYLEQARNYKEVRILGLEGYKDTVGYGITTAGSGSTAADLTDLNNPQALSVGAQGLMAVLKSRPTSVTGGAEVVSVEVGTATYTDPLTGGIVTRASDYLFTLTISYLQPNVGTINPTVLVVSLRPESKDYIVKKLGTNPLAKPKIGAEIAPLWVDFIIPSVVSRPTIDLPSAYYVPGTTVALNYLDLTQGETVFGTTFTFQNATIDTITPSTNDVTMTVASDITTWLSDGSTIEISGISGTGNIAALNGTWKVDDVAFGSGSTSFTLKDLNTNLDVTNIIPTSTLSGSATPVIAKYIIPTWENEMLDFNEITYQTPVTPWFVSDGDANGLYKRLFRLWSISDGTSANSDIKIEISRINPSANNGNGSFDLTVRKWDDRDDLAPVKIEIFANLTLDSTSNNYVLRRIGDGENFPLRSRFVFIEMNEDEEIEADLLPYGVLGYPNVSGTKIPDVPWTLDYDKNKPTAKQTLGLASNKINMNSAMAPGYLSLKNSVGEFGKGFHLNPTNNTDLSTNQASVFQFAEATWQKDALGNNVNAQEKINRSKFVVDFYGGFDGFNVYKERAWGDPSSADFTALKYAIGQLADKEDINSDFTILVTPDMNFQDHAAGCEAVLDMVNSRGDCLYLPDFADDTSADVNAAVDALLSSNMKSNNIAVYFPWLQIEDIVNNINKYMPPSLLALGTITYVSTNENVWQPPGGSIRTVTNNLVKTRRRLNLGDRETLFTANINPITSFPGSGYEIAGVRTTQEEFSALSFVHNRLLLCYAKKVLNQVLRPLLYQLNGQFSEDLFLATVRPIFDRIKKLNGIADFAVDIVNNDQTAADKTTLYGKITIVPLYPIERIIVDFTLQDGAITFSN